MLRARIASFRYAFTGLAVLLGSQVNARLHLLASLAVIAAGLWCGLGRVDWALLVTAISVVWVAEALNTAIEFLADATISYPHPLVARAKDVAAAGVLIAAVAASLLGALVFVPQFL